MLMPSYRAFFEEEGLFTVNNLLDAGGKCIKKVGWKTSVQNFKNNLLLNCLNLQADIEQGHYKLRRMPYFTVIDHGKERHVQSIHVRDRTVQRVICDRILWPYVAPRLIYDNYACQPGKGISMAVKRATKHLANYYQRYKTSGYVLQIDFKSYFENINQEKLFQMMTFDLQAKEMLQFIIRTLNHKGLDLGSQVSQILAIYYANKIDHLAKEKLHLAYYARYMDDIYALHPSKSYLQHCLAEITKVCNELDIKLNSKKTHIIKLKNGFTFLKRRFVFGKNGRVLKFLSHKSIVKNRIKLKKLYASGLPKEDALVVLHSVLGYMKGYNNAKARSNYVKLFKQLYGDIPPKHKKHSEH